MKSNFIEKNNTEKSIWCSPQEIMAADGMLDLLLVFTIEQMFKAGRSKKGRCQGGKLLNTM